MSGRQRDVQRALDALPSGQRELIEQAYFFGLTQSELAARFGLPLGTVKTRIRTGLHALRGVLRSLGIGLHARAPARPGRLHPRRRRHRSRRALD